MNRIALLISVGVWIAAAMTGMAQQPPAEPPPAMTAAPRLMPMATPAPMKGGLTSGAGLTPLAMAAPVGAIPDPHKGRGSGCFNHKLWRYFTYCPVKGGCCKSCSCCCPSPYTFFFCTPIPTQRINAPIYVDMYYSTLVPSPRHTPLTPDPVNWAPIGQAAGK